MTVWTERTGCRISPLAVLFNIRANRCKPFNEEKQFLDALQAWIIDEDLHAPPLLIDRMGLELFHRLYSDIGIRHLGEYLAVQISAMLAFFSQRLVFDPADGSTSARVRPACRVNRLEHHKQDSAVRNHYFKRKELISDRHI